MTRDSDEDGGWNGFFFQTPDGSVNAIESRCWRQSVTDPRRPEGDGVIIHSRIESSHLAGNMLGDPSERDLFVYLPPGYEESERRYPTAYLLQAYGETAQQMITPPTDGQRWQPPIEDVLDPVFERMGTPP